LRLSFVKEAWARENVFGESSGIRFFGLRIAELRVPLERIFVTNDHASQTPRQGGRYIPIKLSQRFMRVRELRLMISNQDTKPPSLVEVEQLTPREEKILFLSQVPVNFSCYVMIRLRGDVLVVDGAHRLFATILRDESLDKISFWLTV